MSSAARRAAVLVCAVAALAFASAGASAETMFMEPAGAIEAATSGSLVTFEFEGTNVSCAMLLRGRLNSSYAMVAGTEVGRITSASASGCSGGEIVFLLPVGWEKVYSSILGEPRNLRGILWLVRNIAFLVETTLFRCLYEIRGGALIQFREEPGELAIRWNWLQRTEIIRTTQLGFLPCPRVLTMTGSLLLRPTERVHIV